MAGRPYISIVKYHPYLSNIFDYLENGPKSYLNSDCILIYYCMDGLPFCSYYTEWFD